MPDKIDIKKILVIGSGPVVIGQGSEYDYAAVEACKALREEDCQVVVMNSNPSAISADAWAADVAYIEPLTLGSITKVIEKERPDALLPTVGGQTALYLAASLEQSGVLAKYGTELIGANGAAITRSEDRKLFKQTMESAGIPVPVSGIACSIEEGMQVIKNVGFPAILRPAYSVGGAGSAISYNLEEFVQMLGFALKTSPISQVLIERSVYGWKEIDAVVLCDTYGKLTDITQFENIDPAGVHSGDSAVVTPVQTLSDDEAMTVSEFAEKAACAIGAYGTVSTRFAVSPEGEVVILSANVSLNRVVALAGRVGGFPIASVATKLAVGIPMLEALAYYQSTGRGPAVKLPRFAFDKFADADTALGPSMKSVGDAVAIGCNYYEAMQKCIRSLGIGRFGLGADGRDIAWGDIAENLVKPNPDRLFYIRHAIETGMTTAEISELSKINESFIKDVKRLVDFEKGLEGKSLVGVSADVLAEAKQFGYSDAQLAVMLETDEDQVRVRRNVLGISTGFSSVAWCPETPVVYSAYGDCDRLPVVAGDKKVIILGGGPGRIGQGSEFDYFVVHAARALTEAGYQSIVINSNPDAVSTDPWVVGTLYLESLTLEAVLDIIDREKPLGVIVQLSGQASVEISRSLADAGVNVFGTPLESIDRVQDRKQLADFIHKLGLVQTASETASSVDQALKGAEKIGYPVLVKSGFLVEGRSRSIIYDADDLAAFAQSALADTSGQMIVIDKFLEDAIEVGVDAVSDGETVFICGVMEHIEQAGVHSADAACALPPHSLASEMVDEVKRQTSLIASKLGIRGLINVLYAVKGGSVYVLSVNPRASRTIPFVTKATGIQWTDIAARVMVGISLKEQGVTDQHSVNHMSVKEAVFPFVRFSGADVVLGPEVKSTGHVMGINTNFGSAYMKAQAAAGQYLPEGGTAFVSIADRDKGEIPTIGARLRELGFEIVATRGTAKVLKEAGVEARVISKIGEGRPDATDLIKNGDIDLIINTRSGKKPRSHEITIRSAMIARGIPIITTIAGAKATLFGMETVKTHGYEVRSLQDYYG
ncbi:MAG: carbamoyl-phosphate synthase large subunit [Armatimonadota bacterium]|nr:carbamoyl-phosphate synthase large subunit [bacterium]